MPCLRQQRRVDLGRADDAVEHVADDREQTLHPGARFGADGDGRGGPELRAERANVDIGLTREIALREHDDERTLIARLRRECLPDTFDGRAK